MGGEYVGQVKNRLIFWKQSIKNSVDSSFLVFTDEVSRGLLKPAKPVLRRISNALSN